MRGLTSEQRAAIDWDHNLVLTACPGSGKTRTLVAKLIDAIDLVRGSPRAIACITYTNSAVQEIEQRAREQLQPADSVHLTVATIHAFCLNEIVRPYGWHMPGLSGSLKVLTRDSPDFQEICDFAAAQVNYHQLSQADYEAFESLAVDSQGRIIGLAVANVAVTKAAKHYWKRSKELGYIDFGRIVYGAFRLLRAFPHVAQTLCARYPWLLVDEFQDTTELQIEILKLLHATGRCKMFVVGDLAQSIYAFTGARPELIHPFAVAIGAREDLSLTGNFRSSSQVVEHGERLITRTPPMVAIGLNKGFNVAPELIQGVSAFEAITDHFLPALADHGIDLGQATILAKDWASLINLSRKLRDFGTPVVGRGARPYRRSRLFAQLAEQICGALVEPNSDTTRQLERALFHTVLDVTGSIPTDVYGMTGRIVIVRLMRIAEELAKNSGAVEWLDRMSQRAGQVLRECELIDGTQAGAFFASVQEMKADMQRQHVDLANLSIEDLGLFASPTRALRLSTIHYAKGREYDAVALIGLRQGAFPHFRATDIDAEKRLLYVGLTRARKVLMYVAEADRWGNPPSPFLGQEGLRLF